MPVSGTTAPDSAVKVSSADIATEARRASCHRTPLVKRNVIAPVPAAFVWTVSFSPFLKAFRSFVPGATSAVIA